jgi:hypothetical protein
MMVDNVPDSRQDITACQGLRYATDLDRCTRPQTRIAFRYRPQYDILGNPAVQFGLCDSIGLIIVLHRFIDDGALAAAAHLFRRQVNPNLAAYTRPVCPTADLLDPMGIPAGCFHRPADRIGVDFNTGFKQRGAQRQRNGGPDAFQGDKV